MSTKSISNETTSTLKSRIGQTNYKTRTGGIGPKVDDEVPYSSIGAVYLKNVSSKLIVRLAKYNNLSDNTRHFTRR